MSGRILGGDGSWVRDAVSTARDRLEELVVQAAEAHAGEYLTEDMIVVLPPRDAAKAGLRFPEGGFRPTINDMDLYLSHEVANPVVMTRTLAKLLWSKNIIF